MNPEFYLILDSEELSELLETTVFQSGFDDATLTMRGGKAAIWIRHREGEFTALMREALSEAQQGGINVLHVEIESGVLA